eukprot:3364801-Amphidinium_carterae.2
MLHAAVVVNTMCPCQVPLACSDLLHSHLAEPNIGDNFELGLHAAVAVMAQAQHPQPRLLICSAGLRNIGAVNGPRTSHTRQFEDFLRNYPRRHVHDVRAIDQTAK